MSWIILLFSFIIVIMINVIKKIYPKFNLNLLLKILVVAYFIIGFARMFMPDDFLLVINGAYDFNRYFDKVDYLSSFLRWSYQTSLVILPISVFFPNNKYIKRIVVFYCLPFLIVNILSFDTYINYFTSKQVLSIRYSDPFGLGKLSDSFRVFELVLEFSLALILEMQCSIDSKIYKMNKSEVFKFILLLIPVIIFTIPIYIPQSLFGYGTIKLTGFTLQNYIWILITILITFIIYFIFRFQSKENRYIVCLFFAINLFVLYNNFYMTGVTISRLPLQLCNLGCYIILLAMITKSQGIFDFIFIANILGTIIAIMVPDASSWKGIYSFFDFHFMYEHMMLFMLPILMVSLGIFKRPDKKGLRNALIGFSVYFIFCCLCGTYLNSISSKTDVTVNYFYIFKTDIVDRLPILQFTRNIYFVWGDYMGYPIYQFLIYLLYCIGCIGLYCISCKFYSIADDHKKLRLIRIKEWEEVTGETYNGKLTCEDEKEEIKGKNLYVCYYEKYRNIFKLKERINCLDYWKSVLVDVINVLIYIFLLVVGYFIFRQTNYLDTFNKILNSIFIVYIITNLWPSVAVTIRRLNDVSKKWYYLFLLLLPIVGWLWLIAILVSERKEETINA